MLVILLLVATVIATLLFGTLLMALIVTMRLEDPSATYELCAVRDGLINTFVFAGVPRDDPWLETLYRNVNRVLLHSSFPSSRPRGPEGWPLVEAPGQFQASNPCGAKQLIPLPPNSEKCPAAIRALGPALRSALEHLSARRLSLYLHVNAREREQRRLLREKAKHLLEMINGQDGSLFA